MLLWRYPQTDILARWQAHWPHFVIIFLIWLLLFYINNLYNLNLKANSGRFLRLLINTTILATLLSILYFYLNVQAAIAPKTNLLAFLVIFIILFYLWRLIYQVLDRSLLPKNNLAIIGANPAGQKLLAELKNNPGSGYQTALVFKELTELASLKAVVQEKNIRAVVICDDFNQSEALRQALFDCLAYQITFFNYPDFYEMITGKVPVESIGSNWFLNNLNEGQKNYFNFLKRLLDFIFAFIILIISLSLWPLLALIIKLESRGPVFFRQIRLGRNEKTFKIIKFRTMRIENNDGAPTEAGDRRITSIGSFLRKTRLDEIPQVLNIIAGEMSFIGPRPERPELAAELEKQIPFYKTRLLIKPGLTGWDQISGKYHSPSPADTLEKLQYDLFYLKQRSFYLDLTITLRTLATIFSRAGR
jgi:exopolysaccharide biosynthesis polyprenyl glycosylphosphotransferase